MTCCDEARLELYRQGLLNPEEDRQVDQHLASCPACRERLAALEWEEAELAQALALSPLENEELRMADLPAQVIRQVEVRRRTEGLLGTGLFLMLVSAAVGLQAFVLPLLERWPLSALAPAWEFWAEAGGRILHLLWRAYSAGPDQQSSLLLLTLAGTALLVLTRPSSTRHADE